MWSYMCLFAELYIGFVPFRGRANVTAVSSLVQSLGPLPKQWEGMFDADDTAEEFWYDQAYTPVLPLTLEEFIKRAHPESGDTERKLAFSVMRKGFAYLPEKRLTAAELLQDEDFKALMELQGC